MLKLPTTLAPLNPFSPCTEFYSILVIHNFNQSALTYKLLAFF